MAAAKDKKFVDKVTEKLEPETMVHFNYQKVFRAGVNPEDKKAVEELICKEYLNGMNFEEYAIAKVVEGIEKDMAKHKIQTNGSGK